ncbi:MAG: discoidin domain-containing protein, partial [Candidatus Aminicenantes bacterium]|nr:discoidin domain-containing protein [Candidatus Aminicenantes bacterium]
KEITENYDKPVVSHEIGQWCVYPNFKEIPKYNGFLMPRNFEIFQDTLQKNHMGHLAEDFLQASGKLQVLCYKAEIEAALRTPGLAGFQLLDLHDFPGQGTALVGILDAFWDQKGYIEPQEFSQFCAPTVLLARMDQRIYTTGQAFFADIEVSHFAEHSLADIKPLWFIQGSNGQILAEGSFPPLSIPIGSNIPLGRVHWPLESAMAPSRYDLVVRLDQSKNSWPFWVYPEGLDLSIETEVLVVSVLEKDTVDYLNSGGTVFLTIPRRSLSPEKGGSIGLGFSPIFWNTAWTGKQKPHTLGLLCDPNHPALNEFPTEFHSNWQWWEIIHRAKAVLMDDLPASLDPIIRSIDDWFENRRLGLLFEAKIGSGKILITSIDFTGDLSAFPSLRQLYYSLIKYMESPSFQPEITLSIEDLQALFNPPSLLDTAHVIKYDSQMPGHEAELIIDDDPSTFWHTPWGENSPEYPHDVVIDLGERKTFKGFEIIPRQDENLNGLISIVYIYLSNDGEWWGGPVITAKFPFTSEPQILRLPRPRSARFIKLEALEGFSEQTFASLAELKIF